MTGSQIVRCVRAAGIAAVLASFVGGSCAPSGSDPPSAHEREHRLLEGKSFTLVGDDTRGASLSAEIASNLGVAELMASSDLAFVASFAGFATEPNAVREIETNLPQDFPRGPWVLAVFKDVRVIRSDGNPVALDLPLAMTVGLARAPIGPSERAVIVSSMDVLPKVGREYLFGGPMLAGLPERCVETTATLIGNGLFEVRGASAVDRDGTLVALATLRPHRYSPTPQGDPAGAFADKPAAEISADVTMYESASLVVSSSERARAPIVAKRCAAAAVEIGGPYTTRADVASALGAT